MNDDEFYSRYYAGTKVSQHVAVRIRHLLAEAGGYCPEQLIPDDDLSYRLRDLEGVELVLELEREFAIHVSPEASEKLRFEIDSVARFVASKLI